MVKMLFFIALIGLTPPSARAEEDGDWGDDSGTTSIYDDNTFESPGFSEDENTLWRPDNRDNNDTHEHNETEISNGFGGTSTRSMGSIVADQLQPSSGY